MIMNINDDLNRALFIWFIKDSDVREEMIIDKFGEKYGNELMQNIKVVSDAFWEYDPDWSKTPTLEEAFAEASKRILEKYPNLNELALSGMKSSFYYSYK